MLTLTVPEGVTVEPVNYPPPDKRKFAFAGDAELLVYEGKLGLTTAIRVPADFAGDRVRIEAELQLPGVRRHHLPAADQRDGDGRDRRRRRARPAPAATATARRAAGARARRRGACSGSWLAERGLLFTLAAVALLGLGLNLTPCVYPLISVTIAYFGGQARGRGQIAGLAALYVLGIALSFSGRRRSRRRSPAGSSAPRCRSRRWCCSSPRVMVVLALGSFGLYQLQPPAALMQRVGRRRHRAPPARCSWA